MSIYATVELEQSGHQDLPPEMDPKGKGLIYGQNLGQCDGIDRLDEIATSKGVRPISDYLDDSLMLSDDERAEFDLPPAVPKWAAIEDGIATLDALIAELEIWGNMPVGQYPADAVLWDLRASAGILRQHANSGERFRITLL